jgi:predicted RND superfamily exporter protein
MITAMMMRFRDTLENWVFGYRWVVLALFAAVSVVLGYQALQLRVDAGFEKLLPLSHPYMKTFVQYRAEFGAADRVLIAVRVKQGDIFTPEYFKTLKAVTDEVFFLPGVDRASVRSIFTPNVRFIEIVEGGFAGGDVVPAEFQPTPEDIEIVRQNILKAGIVGRLVANDFTAAMVSANLVEIDPATGQRLDYLKVAAELEEKLIARYAKDNIDIHIIGFAKAIGDIANGAAGVLTFFAVSFLVTVGLVYLFTHSIVVTLVALFASLLAVTWTLGMLTVIGYGLDPLAILVPFLIFAIGVSHNVQMVGWIGDELAKTGDLMHSCRLAFRNLVVPGGVALITDAIGFIVIMFIEIRIIREFAVTASLGVLAVLFTNLILHPVMMSFVPLGQAYRQRVDRSNRRREPIWRALAVFARPKVAIGTVALSAVLLAFGLVQAPKVAIGDLEAGLPELRADAPYNVDAGVITEKFSLSVDVIAVMIETIPDGCISHDVMTEIDRFQWHMVNVPGVHSALSMPQVAKIISAGWNEGSPKWRVLPRESINLVQAVTPIETATGLLNRDCSVMPVYIFTEDHKAATIERIVQEIEDYATLHGTEHLNFRLATGIVGVMAATNEVIGDAQFKMLFYVYLATILLCLASFRSWRATFCIIAPLELVSVLNYSLMNYLDIGLKVSTLPVAALGVGIGVDYGIYIFSRFETLLRQGLSTRDAYIETLRVTGNSVLVTGLTMSAGVFTWVFSALKFQADMGLLLSFMIFANMLGALFLCPSFAFILYGFKGRKFRPS